MLYLSYSRSTFDFKAHTNRSLAIFKIAKRKSYHVTCNVLNMVIRLSSLRWKRGIKNCRLWLQINFNIFNLKTDVYENFLMFWTIEKNIHVVCLKHLCSANTKKMVDVFKLILLVLTITLLCEIYPSVEFIIERTKEIRGIHLFDGNLSHPLISLYFGICDGPKKWHKPMIRTNQRHILYSFINGQSCCTIETFKVWHIL